MRIRTCCLVLLAVQVLLQVATGLADISKFSPQAGKKQYTQLGEFVHSLKHPNNPTSLEPEGTAQLLQTSNRDSRTAPPRPTPTPRTSSAPSICQDRGVATVIFGGCLDVCAPFSFSTAAKCGTLISLGCALEPCGAGMFSCSLQDEFTANTVVCPGDRVIIAGINTLQRLSFQVDLRGAEPLRTDLYLLNDATFSMGTAIMAVQSNFLNLINVFGDRENVAFGVGFFRDETDSSGGFENLQAVTEDLDAVRAAVNNLEAIGGGDVDEANLAALYRVATDSSIGWREGSRRILVYFGDFPGHEPTCVGSKKITRTEVIEALQEKGITVIGVSFPPPGIDAAPLRPFGSCHMEPAAGAGQASDIISATGGRLISRNSQAGLVNAIGAAVEALPRTFDVDESDCVADIDSNHTPALPLTLGPRRERLVTNTISVRDSICETSGGFRCSYKYTEGGADLGSVNLEFFDTRGCSA